MNKTIARQFMNGADIIFHDGMAEPIVIYERASFYCTPTGGSWDYEEEVEYFLVQLAATYRHISAATYRHISTTPVPGQGSSPGERI